MITQWAGPVREIRSPLDSEAGLGTLYVRERLVESRESAWERTMIHLLLSPLGVGILVGVGGSWLYRKYGATKGRALYGQLQEMSSVEEAVSEGHTVRAREKRRASKDIAAGREAHA